MRGRTITLVGADGAGKTTLAHSIQGMAGPKVTRIYLGVNPASATHQLPTTRLAFWLKRRLGKTVHHSGPPDPSKQRTRPRAWMARTAAHGKSLVYCGLLVSEELYRFAVAGLAVRRGHLVIIDRHPFTDYYAAHVKGTRGWRRLGDRLHGALMMHVYPRPDQVIVLDAPAEELYRRKPEGSLQALEARRQEYLDLWEIIPDLQTVDVMRPLDQVLDSILALVESAGSHNNLRVGSIQGYGPPTEPDEAVLALLQRFQLAGVPVWLNRGWGVDAAVGRITRPHRDIDFITPPDQVSVAVQVLQSDGWTPTETATLVAGRLRVELSKPGGQSVEICGASEADEPDFGFQGHLRGTPVPCVHPAQQLAWRAKGRLTKNDLIAIRLLHTELGVPLPRELDPCSKARLHYLARRAARTVLTLGRPDAPLPAWARRLRRTSP